MLTRCFQILNERFEFVIRKKKKGFATYYLEYGGFGAKDAEITSVYYILDTLTWQSHIERLQFLTFFISYLFHYFGSCFNNLIPPFLCPQAESMNKPAFLG